MIHETASRRPVAEAGQAPTRRGRRRLLRRFRADRRGATAVEFGLIALPFMGLLMAITETAMVMWTQQSLQEALQQTSRTLLTGEARTLYANPATAQNDFKSMLCERMRLVTQPDCSSRLAVDVQVLSSWPATPPDNAVSGGTLDTSGFAIRDVGPSQIAIVRAVMAYPVMFARWTQSMANIDGNQRAIMAVAAFRAEPFPVN